MIGIKLIKYVINDIGILWNVIVDSIEQDIHNETLVLVLLRLLDLVLDLLRFLYLGRDSLAVEQQQLLSLLKQSEPFPIAHGGSRRWQLGGLVDKTVN